MKLASWNLPPADFLVSGLSSGAVRSPFRLVRKRPEECAALLIQEQVDLALLPTSMVIQAAEGLEIIPGVALSSWKYPYARLVLKGGLHGSLETLAYDRRNAVERIVARIVLHEHYGMEPRFVAYENDPSSERLLAGDEDAALLVGNEAATFESDTFAMDLGQEWFELANYPMVWGLLATRKGHLPPEQVKQIVESVQAAEQSRRQWIQAHLPDEGLRSFFEEELRIRFDDLAIASITEFERLLFYYDVISDIPDLRFAEIPEDEDEDADEDDLPLI